LRNQSCVRDSSALHCHATLTGMPGPTLIGHQVVEVCQPREERLLAATRMMEPLHREQFPLDGVMGLVLKRAGHRRLGVCKDRIPAALLALKPAPHPRAIGGPNRGRDVIGRAA
jgi:hypothetical protein